jgi:uncharacterized protein YecE (DUF72 family)
VPVLIGTSGWQYRHWRGGLYPTDLPVHDWLAHYGQRFATVEVNNSFYRLPEKATFEAWAATVPDDFTMAVKASRYLTHVRRLHQPREPVDRLMEHAAGLGPKLGPVLLQLPPNLPIELEALEATIRAFPTGVRLAVEFRHPSWFAPDTRRLLEDRKVALCLTDTDGRHGPLWATAAWGYVRFHGGRADPPSCYGRTSLRTWAKRLAELWDDAADVFVYFNNDAHGCAPRDARTLASVLGTMGRSPTRVPTAGEVTLT